MEDYLALPVLIATILLYTLYKRLTRLSIADIPGPERHSFWTGKHFHRFIVRQLVSSVIQEIGSNYAGRKLALWITNGGTLLGASLVYGTHLGYVLRHTFDFSEVEQRAYHFT